jgi:hypothetical protein
MILEISVRVLIVAIEGVSGAIEIPHDIAVMLLLDDGRIWAAHRRPCFGIVKRERVRVSGRRWKQNCLCLSRSLSVGWHGSEDEQRGSNPCE